MNKLNIGFAGTPEFAAKILQHLLDEGYNVACVYTQPDKAQGRGQTILPSPVKKIALANDIPCEQPVSLKREPARSSIKKYHLDILIVVAYGLILPIEFLNAPKFGAINIHASLLPKWRGAAPIQRAILQDDKKTGITIMQMDQGLDTGKMLLKEECEINADDTTLSLTTKLNAIAQKLIITALSNLPLAGEPQDNTQATYADKIHKAEAIIEWQDLCDNILNKIHAFNPWPIACSTINNIIVKIYTAQKLSHKSTLSPGTIVELDKNGIIVATGSNDLLITQIQLPNKNKIAGADIINSYKNLFQNNKFTS